jgi:hypothetical protein
MPEIFQGHCPMCSKRLLVDDAPPDTASCHCIEEHYACQAKDFSQLWNAFDARVKSLGMDKAVTVYAGKLLRDLRALNVVKRVKAR